MDVTNSITFMSTSPTSCKITSNTNGTNHLEEINENGLSEAKSNRKLFAEVRYFLMNSDLPEVNLK